MIVLRINHFFYHKKYHKKVKTFPNQMSDATRIETCQDCKKVVPYSNLKYCISHIRGLCEDCLNTYHDSIEVNRCSKCRRRICHKMAIDFKCSMCSAMFCGSRSGLYICFCQKCLVTLICKRHSLNFPLDIIKFICHLSN